MIGIVDYGVGNVFSLEQSFRAIGQEVVVTADPTVLEQADKLLLPGVGAFGDASRKLRDTGLDRVVTNLVAAGKPLMGICLGMQLLFEEGQEYGCHKGLGLLPGKVVPMEGRIQEGLKIPHMGWNALHFEKESPLFSKIKDDDCVYFVHSYFATDCDSVLIATTDYGARVTAAVQKGNVFGCQFHPEKSGEAGLNILRAFVEMEV